MSFYTSTILPLAFRLDAERAHHLAIGAGAMMRPFARALHRLNAVQDPRLETVISGLRFRTPLGLAAGFDKSGTAIETLAGLGFGFVEIGSVSSDPSLGNARPRLFRLPEDRAIVVHYGLPNDGARQIVQRLSNIHLPVPLGINLVKTNRGRGACPETAGQIITEYVEAARIVSPVADYLMLNLSCPNTEDGRDFFSDSGHLRAVLTAPGELHPRVPVFLKVSPLGGIATIERVLEATEDHAYVSGFMFNLPSVKPDGLRTPAFIWRAMPGAVSGPPAAALADSCIRETYRRMDRQRYVIIGAGGISTGEDAYAKIRLGASLVQLLTALIYEGPGVVRRITQDLVRLIERDGLIPTALAVDSFWDSQIRESLTRCRLLRGAASMGAAVSITRLDVTAAELRMAAGREKDGSAARRMLAIAMILDGADRKTAAETCGMDRQTLRDWVHRYNAEGMRGLHDRKTPGPEPKLTADQQAKLAELVETGPDPARHGVVRWRRVDLRDELERRFGVVLHERSVGKVLAKLGYCRLSVRPRHPQTDEAAQEAFKKTSPQRSRHGSPTTPKTSPSKSGSRTRHASASKAR